MVQLRIFARRGAALSGVFVLALARAAGAFPSSRLVYARGPGAEQCPDQDAVRQAVAARLGYDPFFPTSDKTIVARISREQDELRGEVRLVDEHGNELGQREFSAKPERCADLVHAMALSISIAIDPKSAETYSNGPPDEPAPGPPVPATEPPPPAAVARPPVVHPKTRATERSAPPPRTLDWSTGVAVLAQFGVAPKTALGGVGFVAGRLRAWSLGLEGHADLPVTRRFGQGFGQVQIRSSTFGLSAVPCFHFRGAFACELTSLAGLSATGTSAQAKSGTSWVISLGGRLGAELPVTPTLGLWPKPT